MCGGVSNAFGVEKKSWIGYGIHAYRYNFTVELATGESYYIGYQRNADSPSEHWTYCKVEFNPAKVGEDAQFLAFYSPLVAVAKHIEFQRFDVAIDIPVARSRVRVVKDARRYVNYEYSAENRTEYLGLRSNHGNVKIYNKAMESKLDYPLTRIEVTLDYENASWNEFKRLYPEIYVLDDRPVDDLVANGTDLVLLLACRENPEYIKLLPQIKRKKIGQLLGKAALNIEPDEISYKLILQEILLYGNRVSAEKYEELEGNTADMFLPSVKFDELQGDQDKIQGRF